MGKGETYLLRFSGSSFYTAVNYNMTISQDEAPGNDECSGAVAISFFNDSVQSISGSTGGATPDVNLCKTGADSRGVWYAFRGDGKLVSINFTGSGWITLFQGLCNDLTCVIAQAIVSEQAIAEEIFAEGDVEYRILVEDYVSSGFELILKQFEPPENAVCEKALTIQTLPFSYSGDMKGAMPRTGCFNDTCISSLYTGVWFTFLGPGTPVQVDLTVETGGYDDTAIDISTDRCSSISAEIYGIYIGSSMAIQTEIGLTYHVYVAVTGMGYTKLPYYINIKI
jgi:hypothetical protein